MSRVGSGPMGSDGVARVRRDSKSPDPTRPARFGLAREQPCKNQGCILRVTRSTRSRSQNSCRSQFFC